ncbi:hypothetical protein HELRODRAFT_78656 [Helobdella robusta]|uniref:PHD-type domain-containing protein n=1 Tax=Helobdella robusta TaxID=6412 RepID=T1G3E2_HELRO|nr:hypothetical protein HELRODRAFT_78656 [Helobdella robusta]ESO04748.1 hypothetical protein HELRODRAFT_78656 [Helobdella robusta]
MCHVHAHCQASKDEQSSKDEEHASTLVIVSFKDQFTLRQDMCLSCGSFGLGDEGRLIACVQCGQCYHPYCVGIKVSPSMLEKGWRCLDCTVCEGCGKPHDESRLILCDECDISYHIYCLDPPLQEVPQGTWKCKWCIMCVVCGSNNPGTNCTWLENFSKCGPCSSLEICPVCCMKYADTDLVLQCAHCDR